MRKVFLDADPTSIDTSQLHKGRLCTGEYTYVWSGEDERTIGLINTPEQTAARATRFTFREYQTRVAITAVSHQLVRLVARQMPIR